MTTLNGSRVEDPRSPLWLDRPSVDEVAHLVSSKLSSRHAPMVLETWAQTYRTSKWAGTVPNNLFTSTLAETIRQLFLRGAQGYCFEDNGELLAYAVVERTRLDEPVVHYVWVHPGCRWRGLATDLLTSAGINTRQFFFYTHRTKFCSLPLFHNGRHEPAIARRKAP